MKLSRLSSLTSNKSTYRKPMSGSVLVEHVRAELEHTGVPETKLLPFTRKTFPLYRAGWFHKAVCTELDQFLTDVREKKSPRLILSASPQHGKSELVSRRMPA